MHETKRQDEQQPDRDAEDFRAASPVGTRLGVSGPARSGTARTGDSVNDSTPAAPGEGGLTCIV